MHLHPIARGTLRGNPRRLTRNPRQDPPISHHRASREGLGWFTVYSNQRCAFSGTLIDHAGQNKATAV
jgi:hypothetical protein